MPGEKNARGGRFLFQKKKLSTSFKRCPCAPTSEEETWLVQKRTVFADLGVIKEKAAKNKTSVAPRRQGDGCGLT